MKKSIKLYFLIVCVFVAGCARNVHLDPEQSQRIESTKLIVVKKQKSLELLESPPFIFYSFDPATMVVGTLASHVLHRTVFLPREKAAFAPINKDLESYNFESELSKHLDGLLVENQHFKFTSCEIMPINNKRDLPGILERIDNDHVAFVYPTYTLDNNMNTIIIDLKLSVYNKSLNWGNKSKLPKPIYQTSTKYKYKLRKGFIFSHVKNARRWNENNSKLMFETLNGGLIKISGDLHTKVLQPFANPVLN